MVDQFENDIFISYAHLDNQPLPFARKPQGWVFGFYETLKIFIGEYLGREPKIWVDKQLEGSDYFGDEIVAQLTKSKLLISVFSPRYVESDWCIKELDEFFDYAEENGGFRIGNKVRVCKVMKYPVTLEAQPEKLQGLLGYDFFKCDEGSEKTIEFRPEFGDESLQNFYLKTSDVAKEVSKIIKTKCNGVKNSVEEVDETIGEEHIEPKLTSVYLAETTFDLQVERDKIRRELEAHGYTVLPNQPLPLNIPDFENKVREHLKSCTLSIHLIGHRYGVVPEGAERSVVELQNKLAAERSEKERAFSRLLWMPEGLPMPEQRQQDFIKSLQDDLELVQSSLEEIKTIILDKLKCHQPSQEPITDKVQIYLICEQRDFEAIEPLYTYLETQEVDVILPPFEGDEAQVRQGHQDKLKLCDAALIYWGNVNELWLQTKLRELQKIAGYGRLKPMLARAIYVDKPQTSQKQRFQTQQALLINKAEALLEDSLKPFLDQITGK